MQLTIVLICRDFDLESYETIRNIPSNVSVLIKCVSCSDNMREMCKDAVHFSIHAKPDEGIYDAFNQALSEVRTDYVLYIGTNDLINLEELDRLQHSLKRQYDIYAYGVRLNDRISNIEKFGDILFYHHQGTVMRTALYVSCGGFTNYEIHADLAALNRIARTYRDELTILEHPGRYLVSYDLGGVSNSGKNFRKSLSEIMNIFQEFECGIWRLGHLKALSRPIYYKLKFIYGKHIR